MQERRPRLFLSVLLPAGAIGLVHLLYLAVLVPWIEHGGTPSLLTWVCLGVWVPLATFVSGALLDTKQGLGLVAVSTTLFRRLVVVVIVVQRMPGFQKFDVAEDAWSYWTWMLGLEVAGWLVVAWAGRQARRAIG